MAPGDGHWPQQRPVAHQYLASGRHLGYYALHDQIAAERPAFASKIKSLCAHPGPTDSGLQAKTTQAGGTRLLDQYILWRTLKAAQSVEDGALGITRACCAPGAESLGFYGPVGSGSGWAG